jgi:hypothetical protein
LPLLGHAVAACRPQPLADDGDRRLGRSFSLRRTSADLVTAMEHLHSDGALHRRGGAIETATQWAADRIRRAMGRPCADNGQCAPRFPRIGVGALVAAMVKAELESLNVALSAATRSPFTGTSPWAHVSMGRLRSPTNEDCHGRAKREPLGPVRGAGATRRPAREP